MRKGCGRACGMGQNMKHIGIYIHIPFCVRKCNYCDFLSAPGDFKTQELYLHALCRQIRLTAQQEGALSVCSIFIGGGTPSIWQGEWIRAVLSCVRENFFVEPDAEITIECNPGTLDAEKLKYYRSAGINRLSVGLQSANNARLSELGRIHTWEDFLQSWKLVREAGFTNVNIDLMSALPNQTLQDYEDTVKKVLELSPEHISAYSLIVEEGTPFYEQELNLPDEDTEREMYYRTKELLTAAGYQRYEISNYARPGFECRHNQLYWTGEDYLGFGIGAASLLCGQRYKTLVSLPEYIRQLSDTADINVCRRLKTDVQTLTVKDQMEEFCFLGLRRMKGISMKAFEECFGTPFLTVYGDVVKRYGALGLLCREGDCVALSDAGIDVSNAVLADFLL